MKRRACGRSVAKGKKQATKAGEKTPRVRVVLRSLLLMGAPLLLRLVCMSVMQTPGLDNRPELDSTEFFAGKKAITLGYRSLGFAAASFELQDDQLWEDFLSPRGFAHAITLVLKTRWGGALWGAPVCSTLVWINRATSRRSALRPLGDETRPSVAQGNMMIYRMVVLIIIANARGLWWCIEQPKGSLMDRHPAFQSLMGCTQVFRHCTFMGRFGAETAKPTWVWSNKPWVADIEKHQVASNPRSQKMQLVSKYVDKTGRARVSGNKNLKASQTYPAGFGIAIASVYRDHQKDMIKHSAKQKRFAATCSYEAAVSAALHIMSDTKDEADFQPVLQFLAN